MKPNMLPRIIVTAGFVGLLAGVAVLGRARTQGGSGPVNVSAAVARYGFGMEEVSREAGIDFVHQAPTLDARLSHIMAEVASMGAAVSVVDYDRDGWNDLYVTDSGEGTRNRLYHNLKNGSFKDVAGEVGLADLNQPGTGVSMGAIWGDYDNDGFEDVVVYKWGQPELFHNDGGKTFTRATGTAGFPRWANCNSGVWFDYDADGKLDLFLGGYYPENVDLWHLQNTRMMPDSFEYAQNGGRKYLFRNLGGGRFQDVTSQVGINSRRWALAAAAADLRGTGRPDLIIANDYGVPEFYANEGGHFREIGKQVGIAEQPKSGMNVSFGDVDNSGQFSMYISNISEPGFLIQGNNLWVPNPGSSGDSLKYENMADSLGVELGGWSFGAQFGDLNNDGRQDLFLTNGYVSAGSGSYWYDFSKVAGGNSAIISDAKNWPAIAGRSHSGRQRKLVWINGGSGHFSDVAPLVGVNDTFDGRSVVTADLWNRGVLDVVEAHQKGPLMVYRNTVAADRDWVDFDLEGSRSNRSAIGAQVRVFWNGQQQLQQVSGGSGFCAQNQRRLHFGLGRGARIEKVVVRWPSGKEQTLADAALRTVNHVKEPV